MLSALLPKNSLENRLLTLLFVVFFIFFIQQAALFSPDTYSYLRADITRFPGYIIYLRGLEAVFGNSYATAAIAGHLVMGIIAISVFFKNVSRFFKLGAITKVALVSVLLFPYFKQHKYITTFLLLKRKKLLKLIHPLIYKRNFYKK